MKTVLLAIAGPILFACACATTPKDERWFQALEEEHIDTRAWFPAADTILEGFDESPPFEVPFLTGEQILYGVSISRPGERKTWLMHMEVVDSFDGLMSGTLTKTLDGEETKEPRSSIGVRLQITLYDEQGTKLGENESRVPGDFLRLGFHEASREYYEAEQLGDEDRNEDTQSLLEQHSSDGLLAFMTFTRLISDNELLSPILWEAMPMPNLFSVLFNFGVVVQAGPSFNAAVPYRGVGTEDWGSDAYRLPLRFGVNGDWLLFCSAVVVPPRSPLHVGAGIVSIVARRSGDDPMRCRLQVLASRRGSD